MPCENLSFREFRLLYPSGYEIGSSKFSSVQRLSAECYLYHNVLTNFVASRKIVGLRGGPAATQIFQYLVAVKDACEVVLQPLRYFSTKTQNAILSALETNIVSPRLP